MSTLYERIVQLLMQCDEFSDEHMLQAVFGTADLKPFAHRRPQSNTIHQRVIGTADYLGKQKNRQGESGLLLLLKVLLRYYDEEDSRHDKLQKLVNEMQTSAVADESISHSSSGGKRSPRRNSQETVEKPDQKFLFEVNRLMLAEFHALLFKQQFIMLFHNDEYELRRTINTLIATLTAKYDDFIRMEQEVKTNEGNLVLESFRGNAFDNLVAANQQVKEHWFVLLNDLLPVDHVPDPLVRTRVETTLRALTQGNYQLAQSKLPEVVQLLDRI